jgi:hypothetical protein
MPRLTNVQKQENYRKWKKEAEEGSQTLKEISGKIQTPIQSTSFFIYFALPSLKQLKYFNTRKKRSPTFNLTA